MNADKLYRKAVNVLKPNKAKMEAIHKERQWIRAQALELADHRLKLSGKTATELYREACAARRDDESSIEKEIRVILLGMARKEM